MYFSSHFWMLLKFALARKRDKTYQTQKKATRHLNSKIILREKNGKNWSPYDVSFVSCRSLMHSVPIRFATRSVYFRINVFAKHLCEREIL